MCVYMPEGIYVHHTHADALGGQKRVMYSLKLELQLL